MAQHRNDVTSNKPDENISGISKHARHCTTGTINWDEPRILATFNDKSKKALQQNCLIRENLEIRRQKTSAGEGLNDPQLCIKSNAWDPILQLLRDTWFYLGPSFVWGGRGPESLSLSPISDCLGLVFCSLPPVSFPLFPLSLSFSFPYLIAFLSLSFHFAKWSWIC